MITSQNKAAVNRRRAVIFLGAMIACLSAVHAADWPQWRGPNRDGISAETGWMDAWPPVGVWTQRVGEGFSAASISSGRVFTAGYNSARNQDVVYCFNVTDGKRVWSFTNASSVVDYLGPRATPTVDGTNVYFHNHQGRLYGINKSTGAQNWFRGIYSGRPGWGFAGSPLADTNLLFLNSSGAGTAVAKTGTTHSTIWTNAGTAGYCSPLFVTWSTQRSVAVISGQGLFGLNPQNGRTNWWYSWSTPYSSADPVLYGDKIFLTSTDRSGCTLLQLGTGQLNSVYFTNTLVTGCSTPVLLGDYLYGFGQNYSTYRWDLACIDIRTGVRQWSLDDYFGDSAEGSLIAADGRLILLSRKGKLSIVKATPTGYSLEGRSPISVVTNAFSETGDWYTAPALANGVLYCRSEKGFLVALRLAGAPTDTNGDSIADTWQQQHFGGTTNAPADGDGDVDGGSNLAEYVAGTDPTNAESNLKLRIGWSNGVAVVNWPTRRVVGTGYDESKSRFYRLETRASLLSGTWQPVPGYTNVLGDDTTRFFTNAAPGTSVFYRVRVWMQ
jgi:outer membrane protein assembly factor BamB